MVVFLLSLFLLSVSESVCVMNPLDSKNIIISLSLSLFMADSPSLLGQENWVLLCLI